MELALTAKKKLGFVIGSYKKPEFDSEELENWRYATVWSLRGF